MSSPDPTSCELCYGRALRFNGDCVVQCPECCNHSETTESGLCIGCLESVRHE